MLERITLTNFKRHENLTVEFGAGPCTTQAASIGTAKNGARVPRPHTPLIVTGRPCKRGHLSPRYVDKNGKPSSCVECKKLQGASDYSRHREVLRPLQNARMRASRQAAREDEQGAAVLLARNSWSGARQRCLNPNHPRYKDYGGRGIQVAAEWSTFKQFQADMGLPRKGDSLDRVDVNGPYSKDNCRWLPLSDQKDNQRRTVWLTARGKTMTAKQWSLDTGVRRRTILRRLQAGWPAENCLKPTRSSKC